jgi:hypothetical protein
MANECKYHVSNLLNCCIHCGKELPKEFQGPRTDRPHFERIIEIAVYDHDQSRPTELVDELINLFRKAQEQARDQALVECATICEVRKLRDSEIREQARRDAIEECARIVEDKHAYASEDTENIRALLEKK